MICVLHGTNSCKSSTARVAKSLNDKIVKYLNFSVSISYLLPTCQEKLMEE